MFKKVLLLIILSFLVSCGSGSNNSDVTSVLDSTISQTQTGTSKDYKQELETKTLKNGVEINMLSFDIIVNTCDNLEGKVDYLLEGDKKIPGKIGDVVSFVADFIKEDRSAEDYNSFVALKDGKKVGIYQKFVNISDLEKVFSEFENKEDFFMYLSNYMLFLDTNTYSQYKEKYLTILSSSKEELKETPFMGIILAEFKHNSSCSKFIENNFISK